MSQNTINSLDTYMRLCWKGNTKNKRVYNQKPMFLGEKAEQNGLCDVVDTWCIKTNALRRTFFVWMHKDCDTKIEQNFTMPSTEELRRMSEIDVRNVDPDELVDINDIIINSDLPVEERVKDYIRQVKNPYCYKSRGVVVKISFAGSDRLEECLARCISLE